MKTLLNFKSYVPNETELKVLAEYLLGTDDLPDDWLDVITRENILFSRSENGEDWYMAQPDFDSSTLKVLYDREGFVRSASMDVSALPDPAGLSVTEISSAGVPDGFAIDGNWMVSDGQIIAKPVDYVSEAEQEKARLMVIANNAIAPLQDASDFGIATETEQALLIEWKKYRVALNRVDTSLAPGITWPVMPGTLS